MYSNYCNDFYTIMVIDITEEKAHDIINAFADRDIEIDIDDIHNGMCSMMISNIREITMTPFMIWFLHHVDKHAYYKIIIS